MYLPPPSPSPPPPPPPQVRHESTDCGLKDVLADIIPEKQKEVKEFRAQHGSFVVGEVTIDMVSLAKCVCVCVCDCIRLQSWPLCICIWLPRATLVCHYYSLCVHLVYISLSFTCIACARLRGYTMGAGCTYYYSNAPTCTYMR